MTDMPDRSAIAFVRTEQLPQQSPPQTEAGVQKWMRENLFPSIGGSILTVCSLIVIIAVLAYALPWLLRGTWITTNLSECRDIFQGARAGCFSVLTDRWQQLVFGFTYPAEHYWRPTLAFVLVFAAIAPVLFFDLPRKLLIFTGLYPFLAFWLIWGGAYWTPLMLIAGFAVAYVVYRAVMARSGDGPAIIAGFVALVFWLAFVMGPVGNLLDRQVGTSRMVEMQQELTAQTEVLPDQIAELEAQIAALDAEITPAVEAARKAAEIEVEVIVDGETTIEKAFDGPVLRKGLAALYSDRAELKALRLELGRLKADLSDKTNLLGRIDSLPELEAGLPDRRAEVERLFDELPDTVAAIETEDGMEALEQRNRDEDLGIAPEDFAALEAALEARIKVVNDDRTIARTYSDVALVGLEPVPSRSLGGFMLNMILGVVCVSLSLPLGIALALGRQSDMPVIRGICVVFIEFIRGVPLITLLFVASVVLAYFFPPEANIDLVLRVIIMITMFSAAYIAEVIRGGLAALPRGQYEAADSLGLDYAQAMRLIILPQALKISIPGIVNVAVGLFKDTVLVSVISMFDLLGMIRGPVLASTDWNGVYWELLGFACVLFFVVCYGISQYSQWLERRLATDHR